MLRLRDISEDTALFPWNKSTPYPAVESTVAIAVALVLGKVTGHPGAGSIAAGSAFTVGFAVFHEALSSTLLSMAVLTFGIASATLAGSLGAPSAPAVMLLCVLAAANYGLLSGLDALAGWVGQQCAVFVVIASYFANGPHYALGRSAMVLLGGALQMAVYAGSILLRRAWTPDSRPPLPLWRQLGTRAGQLWVRFRHELHWEADTTGYVIRLTVTLCLSTALYRTFHWHNGYWAPMTAVLVLKPKWASTLSRGIARLAGTLAGAAVCAFIAAVHPPFGHGVYFVLVLLTAWVCFALQAVNYAVFCLFLTLNTVYLFALGGFSERAAADIRLVNTAIGGLLALLVDFLAQGFGPTRPGDGHEEVRTPLVSTPSEPSGI